MRSVISVDPFKCRVWKLHDRVETDICVATCEAEIESFRTIGQLVPVLGRRVHDDAGREIELIYGARRLFIAQHLQMPLLVDVRVLSDVDGIVAMDIENRLRADISPYERGMNYARLLRIGHFASQDDIAHVFNVSRSHVSRLLRLAKLPVGVVDAFRCATEIQENWGLDLMNALNDPHKRKTILRAARSLAGRLLRLPGRDVYRHLLAPAARGRKPKTTGRDRVVLGADGSPLFRIKYRSNSIALILPSNKVSAVCLQQIEANLKTVLQQADMHSLRWHRPAVERMTPSAPSLSSGGNCEGRRGSADVHHHIC